MLQEVLFNKVKAEQDKLNKGTDRLLILCDKYKEDKLDFGSALAVGALVTQYDELADSISNLHVAILECGDNKELLMEIIPFMNNLSLNIACFVSKVFETEEDVFKWN